MLGVLVVWIMIDIHIINSFIWAFKNKYSLVLCCKKKYLNYFLNTTEKKKI